VLLLIHRATRSGDEYALDQFVLRGGKLMPFVDPYAYFDQAPTMAGHPAAAEQLDAADPVQGWGLEMDRQGHRDVVFARAAVSATRRPCFRSTAPRSAATTWSPDRSRPCSMRLAGLFKQNYRWNSNYGVG